MTQLGTQLLAEFVLPVAIQRRVVSDEERHKILCSHAMFSTEFFNDGHSQ